MGLADELAYATAARLAAGIRDRELSPVEVVDAVIERIQARNPSINAIVYEGFAEAREAARAAEGAVAGGKQLGPLHGVPIAMKDLFDFKPGWPVTFGGIRALKDLVLPFHCGFAARMEQAGAIIVGKTNSPVMGFRGTCDNPLFGPSRNPFNTTKNTGGSSGGSAAAVADGLLPIAEGTDAGGSIRIPASWCGVYGYQPSFGRVPTLARPNGFVALNPFIYEGPITRTVEDAALAMTALGGYHPADPFSLRDDPDYLGALARDIAGMRIAYSANLDVYPVDRRVAEVVEQAVRVFADAGAQVEEVSLGIQHDQRELSDLWCRLLMPVNQATLAMMKAAGIDIVGDHREDLPPEFLHWLEATEALSAVEVIQDQHMRTEIFDAVQHVFADHDLLVSPTLAALPVDNADDGNTVGPSDVEGVPVNPLIGWCMTYFTNFTGHPSASIPAGFADGLPVGMQIIGPRLGDVDVLAASATFERLRPWHESYERCARRSLDRAVA